MHSGMMLDSGGGKCYMGGQEHYIDNCDPDRWSKLEVDDVLEKLGHDVSRLHYYYLKPGMSLDEGLVRLFDNISSMEIAELGVQRGMVDVYAVQENDLLVSQLSQELGLSDVGTGAVDVEASNSGYADVGADDFDIWTGDGIGGDRRGGDVTGDTLIISKLSETSEKAKNNDKAKAIKKGKNKVDGDSSRVVDEDPEDDPSFVDSDYDLSEHEEDAIMAVQVEGWKKVVDQMSTHPMEHIGDTSDSDSPSSGTEDELDYDDKLLTRRYKKATDFNDPRWEVGMRFNCKDDFTELIRHQGVVQGKKLRLKKNDKSHCVAHCRGVLSSKNGPPCPWYVRIRFIKISGYWQISRL